MYAPARIKPAGLAADSGHTSNTSTSVMNSISEQDERGVPLDDDCPDYDAVVSSYLKT